MLNLHDGGRRATSTEEPISSRNGEFEAFLEPNYSVGIVPPADCASCPSLHGLYFDAGSTPFSCEIHHWRSFLQSGGIPEYMVVFRMSIPNDLAVQAEMGNIHCFVQW